MVVLKISHRFLSQGHSIEGGIQDTRIDLFARGLNLEITCFGRSLNPCKLFNNWIRLRYLS